MLTLQALLDRTWRTYGQRLAIVDREGRYTWAEHLDRVMRAATVLQGLGLRRGERFGVISHNSFRQAEIFHAAYWVGIVPVPLNYRLAPAEMQFILEDADVKAVLVEDAFLPLFQNVVFAPWHERVLVISAATSLDTHYPLYENLITTAAPAEPVASAEDDDAILLYTGGTTARGKGVRLTHRNVYTNGMQCAVAHRVRYDDIFLHVAPMFHSADLQATCITLIGGCHCYLPVFSGQAFLAAVQDFRITTAMLAPTMIIMTLTSEDISRHDLGSLRLLIYGSSPMDVEWIKKTVQAFPNTDLQQCYGLTETSPILVAQERDDHRRALESGNTAILRCAGRPLPGVELRILNDDGVEVPTGHMGEVVVRGPNVSKGYLNRPEENQRAFRDGWFHTGDAGCVDDNGYLTIMDRLKDMVVTGGENVYTSEVEAAIYKHSAVQEVAVFGVPDDTYGEALFAAIVPAPGASLGAEQVIAHCRQYIGGYKIPRRIVFIEQMPKSAMGKIQKNELRRHYGKNNGK